MNPEGATRLFDTLFAEHRRVLYAYLFGQVGSRESAEDLLQETFVRVWRHIEDAQRVPVERQRFWLLAIARNLALDFRRRGIVRERGETALAASPSPATPEQLAVARETFDRLDDAIYCLPDTLRTVLTLHVLGDLTSAEVGQVLGRPPGTVRYQLAEARKRLAQVLQSGETT
jgi:RNA polymerase sigma-70 factor (ECF subfamily)